MDGPEKELKHLQLMEQASASISDGDLVDTLIHGYVAGLIASLIYSYF
jgi:replication factor C subunit 1